MRAPLVRPVVAGEALANGRGRGRRVPGRADRAEAAERDGRRVDRRAAPSGPLDKAARASLFGAARGVFVVCAAYLVGSYLIKPDLQPDWVRDAYLIDPVQEGAHRARAVCCPRPTGRTPGRAAAAPTSRRPGLYRRAAAGAGQAGVAATLRSTALTDPDRRMPFDDDKPKEECGIFAIFGHATTPPPHAALGLHALQHRGQEAAGIVSFDGAHFHSHRAVGLIGDTFSRRSVIEGLPGHAAIGHARYSTTGASMLRNVQPLFADFAFGGLAVAHNGNLTNAMLLRRRLVEAGSLFQSTTDTEVIIHLIARSQGQSIVERLVDALRQVEGAWSLVGLFDDGIIGVRDPLGVRPLVLGQLDGAWILASETCALDIMGADFVRDIEPGEVVVIDARGRAQPAPVRARAAALLHLRICLLRAARQRGRGQGRLRGQEADRRRARARERRAGRRRRAGARQRRAGARSATPRNRASPSSSASSATTMSAAPSSSPPTRSAIWA